MLQTRSKTMIIIVKNKITIIMMYTNDYKDTDDDGDNNDENMQMIYSSQSLTKIPREVYHSYRHMSQRIQYDKTSLPDNVTS